VVTFERAQSDKMDTSVKGTGQWLLRDVGFRQWLESPDSNLLWVNGKHGSGKSYLAAHVIDHLSRTAEIDDLCGLAYIYCSPSDLSDSTSGSSSTRTPLESSAAVNLDRLIGSILRQLLHQLPASISLPRLYQAHA
jgi:hypothetical protein